MALGHELVELAVELFGSVSQFLQLEVPGLCFLGVQLLLIFSVVVPLPVRLVKMQSEVEVFCGNFLKLCLHLVFIFVGFALRNVDYLLVEVAIKSFLVFFHLVLEMVDVGDLF